MGTNVKRQILSRQANTRVKQRSLNELNAGLMLRYCVTSSKQVILTNTDIQTGLLLLPSVLKICELPQFIEIQRPGL